MQARAPGVGDADQGAGALRRQRDVADGPVVTKGRHSHVTGGARNDQCHRNRQQEPSGNHEYTIPRP